MKNKLLPTHEIGSLKKPSWYNAVRKGRPPSEADLAELQRWSRLLDLDSTPLRKLLTRRSTSELKRETLEWAVRFALRLQEKAGLDAVWDGEFWRSEMYEDPVSRIPGLRFTASYRGVLAFDDNYYRPAECVTRPKKGPALYVDELKFVKSQTKRVVKVPLTDPHTLATWSYNVYYLRKLDKKRLDPKRARYEAKRDFTLDLAKGPLRHTLRELIRAGAEAIQLDAPAAITDLREFDRAALRQLGYEQPLYVEAFNEATAGLNCEFHAHVCFPPDHGYEHLFPYVAEMKKCRQFSLEFANRDNTTLGVDENARIGYASLKEFKEYASKQNVGLGVVDVHTDAIEPPELVRDRILYAAKILGDPRRIAVCPDCGMRTRTWDVTYEKLRSMVRGAEMAREKLGS